MRKKQQYKALMLDVDGTIVANRRDALPSQRVTEAIEKAKDQIHIGIVTGRPLFHMYEIFEHLQLSGPAILDNGTQIIDAVTKKVLWEKAIDIEDIPKILAIITPLEKIFLVKEGDTEFPVPIDYVPKKPFGFFSLGFTLEEANKLEQTLSHISTVTIHKMLSWDSQTDIDIYITHAEATKQHAIFEVGKILGIKTSEIIGVGDAYNDFPLLMACGLKIAMGNAVEELKAIADYIAPSVEEDGVADVIEKFVL